jgi:hypothetical protein
MKLKLPQLVARSSNVSSEPASKRNNSRSSLQSYLHDVREQQKNTK